MRANKRYIDWLIDWLEHINAGEKHIYPDKTPWTRKRFFFTIATEIHAGSLANFYGQYADRHDRHMNLKFMRRVSARERAIRQFEKQIDVSL